MKTVLKPSSRISWIYLAISVAFILLITLPFVYAYLAAGSSYVFEGFLVNPIDGNSYLAKIYQGWEGNWRFKLPYTVNAGDGAYIFLFYLFLGHLSRILGLSTILTYHLTRIGAALAMLVAIKNFFNVLSVPSTLRPLAFGLAAFGSGLGWISLLFGGMTADFWVSETYPYLSALSNPHFPLGIALLLWMVTPSRQTDIEEIPIALSFWERWKHTWVISMASLILAIISPFGVIIALTIMTGMILWDMGGMLRRGELGIYLENFRQKISMSYPGYQAVTRAINKVFWISLGGGPMLLYYLWVTGTNPQLAGWNEQNLTPSPPVWDLVLSLSPAILLALGGIWYMRLNGKRSERLLAVWMVLSLLLLYIPFGLQRRFMMGLYIPVVGLAVMGLWQMAAVNPRMLKILGVLLLLFSLPTNLLLLTISAQGIPSHSELFYLTNDESAAMEWIEKNTPLDAVILASPNTGLFIPARTGRGVVYGHPFETVEAEENQAAVIRFFQGKPLQEDVEIMTVVDFIYLGPRERALGGPVSLAGFDQVYHNNQVAIYQVVR